MNQPGRPAFVTNDEIAALLHRISEQLEALPDRIAAALERQRSAPRPLSRPDEAALAALLPVIAAAVGKRSFSVHELHEHARLPVAPAVALRAALAAVGSPRKIGRLLCRADGVDVGGRRIAIIGPSRDGMSLSIVTETRKTNTGG